MYAVYARQSADRADSISIETQTDICIRSIPYGEKYEIFADRGFSGSNTNRPAFQKMLEFCRQNKPSKIITYKLDRISRSLLDFVLLLDILQESETELISCTESFSSKSEMGILIMKLLIMFAEMERKNIRMRVRDNYYSRAEKGYYLGGYPPYGYKKKALIIDGKNTSGYEIIPHEARIIKNLFREFASGKSINSLCRKLNCEKLKTKKGKPWTAVAVSRILNNPFYACADENMLNQFISKGWNILCCNENFNGSYGCVIFHSKQEKSDVKVDNFTGYTASVGRHKWIIPSLLWIEVQSILSKTSFKNSTTSSKSFLSGLVKCGFTEKKYTVTASGKNVYFYCRHRKEQSCDLGCKGKNLTVKASTIEDTVDRFIKLHLLRLSEINVTLPSKELNNLKSNLTAVEIKISQLKEEIISLETQTQTDQFIIEAVSQLLNKKEEIEKNIGSEVAKSRKKCYTVLREAAEKWDSFPIERKKFISKEIIEGIYLSENSIRILLK